MSNFDATTPQLKLVKGCMDVCITLDINNIAPFISKDYKFQTFPKIADRPDETKEKHFERYGTLLSLLAKLEVRMVQNQGTTSGFTN